MYKLAVLRAENYEAFTSKAYCLRNPAAISKMIYVAELSAGSLLL